MAETAVVAAITKAISGASATTIAVGAAATAAVASIAISSVQMKKAQADARKDGSRAPRDITVRSAIEPARIIYGQARTSGPVVYTNTASTPGTTDNSTLWTVISLCNHEVEDITDVWLDGDEILASQIVGGNVTSGKYGPIGSNHITNIYKRYGTSTQTHVTALSSAFTDWTSAYDGKGVAYIVTGFELGTATGGGEGVWAQGAPQNIRAVVKGKKVYDPRLDSTQTGIPGSGSHRLADSSTWEWSDNPALCVADYLFDDRLGMGAEGITYNEIDWEMVAAAADVCDCTGSGDSLVPTPAGNQKRYTCNGALSTGETYAENIKQLLSSMGGSITWSGGKFRIRALAYEAPTYSFTGDDVIGDIQIQPEVNRADRFNLVRGTFIDADSDYVATEFLPVESTTFRDDRDDGQSLNKQIKLPFTNNEYMAQRIAFKHLNVADQQLRCVVPMNYKAMKVAVGDRIQLSIDELTWTNKPFIVEGWVFAPDGGYELELREEDQDAYDDPVLGDYATRTYAGDVIFPDPDVPAPSGLTATNEQEAVVLSWDEPSRPSAYNEIIVYASSSSAFSGASEIGRTRGNTFRHEIDIVPATYPGSATFYYWVQAVDIEGETSLKNPNSSTSTIQGIAQKISTDNLDDDANFAQTADWPYVTDSNNTRPDNNATNNGSTIDTDGNIAGEISIETSGKIYLGEGNFNDADTGFYVDDTGQFSLEDKLAFYPTDSTLRVKGNIEADVISVTDSLQVAGNLVASSLQDGSITSAMLTEEAINAIFDRIATNLGGTNGDYKEQNGSFQTSGGTVLVGTSSDKFDHGNQDVVVELVENYGFSQTTDYTGSALDATVQFQVSADGTFTDLTSLNRTQTFTLSKYNLSAYYGSQTYIWYYGPRLLTTTYTAAQLSDNTDYQFRAVISSVGNAFTGIIYPVTLEVNEGVQGVTSAGGDANTLDGLDSTQFLRSDATDTMNGSLTITGDLTVNGTTVTLNTSTLDVEDKNITLNYGAGDTSGSANGAGITIQDAVNSSTDATILWDATNDEFDFSHKINVSGTSTFGGIRVNNSNTALSQGGGNALRIQTNSGYIEVGPRNGTYAHFNTDRGKYYFEKPVHFDGQIYNYNAGATDQPYWHAGNDGSGSGLDADTVDGLEASSLLRSDASDNFSGDFLEFQDNKVLRFGASADYRIWHDGASGHTYFRNYGLAGNTYFQSEDNAGTNHAMIYLRGDTSAPYVQLYYDGSEVMRTQTGGIKVNYSVLGRGIRASNRGELHLNGTGTTDVAEIFFGYGDGFAGNDNKIRWGISDRGTTNGTLQFYKGPANSGGSFEAVANFSAGHNRFNVVGGYDVNGTTVINSARRGFFDRVYVGAGENDGFFYSDLDGRTAFASGDFYIQNSVSNFYNYATNQYYGGTSGDNIYFRGNALSGDNWTIETTGHFTSEQKLSVVTSGTHNELLLLRATSDRFADMIMTDNGGSIRLRQDFGEFQVYTGGSANNGGASGAAKRFEVTASGINVSSGAVYMADTSIITSSRAAQNLASVSLDAGDGKAYGFWDSSTNYAIWMSSAGNSTYGGRAGNETTSDYNMYFKMQSGTNRGFVFKDEANAFFSINPNSGVHSEVPGFWLNYFRMENTGTATASTTSYPSQEMVFRSSGWDTNNSVARNCDWHVRAEASPSAYPDQSLVFYEQVPSYGHKKFELHGRNSGASYQHPDAATFYGNVNIEPTSDSTGGELRIDGLALRKSTDRSGLIELLDSGTSWTGFQITQNEGNHWSFMGNHNNVGIYDDLNAKWIVLYYEASYTSIYYNGAEKIRTQNTGARILGNLTADANVTAYSDRRLKSDIQTLDGTKVLQMRGVSYIKDGERGSGVIAQELEEVAPELVHDGEYKSVAYGNLVGYLIEAVKNQQQQIDELKALIKEMKDGDN